MIKIINKTKLTNKLVKDICLASANFTSVDLSKINIKFMDRVYTRQFGNLVSLKRAAGFWNPIRLELHVYLPKIIKSMDIKDSKDWTKCILTDLVLHEFFHVFDLSIMKRGYDLGDGYPFDRDRPQEIRARKFTSKNEGKFFRKNKVLFNRLEKELISKYHVLG